MVVVCVRLDTVVVVVIELPLAASVTLTVLVVLTSGVLLVTIPTLQFGGEAVGSVLAPEEGLVVHGQPQSAGNGGAFNCTSRR